MAKLSKIFLKLGLLVLVGSIFLAVVGAVALDPDYGMFGTSKNIRFLHKYTGKTLALLSFVVIALGVIKMEKDKPIVQVKLNLIIILHGKLNDISF